MGAKKQPTATRSENSAVTKPPMKLVLILCGAASVILLLFIVLILPQLRQPVLGLYGVDAATSKFLTSQLQELIPTNQPAFAIEIMDPGRPLADQLTSRGPDLVLAPDGLALSSAAAAFLEPSDELARLMPSAMRKSGVAATGRYGLPVQLDIMELACRTSVFGADPSRLLTSFADLERLARKQQKKNHWPLACAGGNDLDFLLLISSLIEARGGWQAVVACAKNLSGPSSLQQAMLGPLGLDRDGKEFSLKDVLDQLVAWRAAGLIHPEWFRMKDQDLVAFMDGGLCSMVFMPLSRHRALPLKTLREFTSMAVPGNQPTTLRGMAANLLVGAVPRNAVKSEQGMKLLAMLVESATQQKITGFTGLGPVNSASEALDLQATNARLWLASSQQAVGDIGWASTRTGAGRDSLAADLRAWIERGGK